MFQNLFGRTFFYTFFGLLVVSLLSLATFFSPLAFSLAFWGVLVCTLVLGFWRFPIAVFMLCAELFAGSQGRLLSVTVHGFSFSLRMGIFLVVALLWVYHRQWSSVRRFRASPIFWWFCALVAVVVLGSVIGYMYGNQHENLFFDVNGYLFLFSGLFFFAAIRNAEDVRKVLSIFAASLVFSAFFALVLLAVFSHGYPGLAEVYRWVRDTRMFEITSIGKNFYRIFSQAHVFSLTGFLLFFSAWYGTPSKHVRLRRAMLLLTTATATTLLISFSRSYWFSLAATALIVLFLLFRRRASERKRSLRLLGIFPIIVLVSITIISFTANYPYLYGRPGGKTTLALLQSRSTDVSDVAAASRYALFKPLLKASLKHPIFGSGFGTTVTFRTTEPRIVAQTGGLYTTYAFEWGYLDTFLKLGVVGVLLFFGIFVSLQQEARLLFARTSDPVRRSVVVGLLLGLIALYLTHAVSPYLNHPTGLGFFMLMAAVLASLRERHTLILPRP